jgi:hypothetical protein
MLDVVGCMKFWVGDGGLVHHHCNSSYFRPRTTTMFMKKQWCILWSEICESNCISMLSLSENLATDTSQGLANYIV